MAPSNQAMGLFEIYFFKVSSMQDNTQEKTHESGIRQEPVKETGYGAVH